MVGALVGAFVGAAFGAFVGDSVGPAVGDAVGARDGAALGEEVGAADGALVTKVHVWDLCGALQPELHQKPSLQPQVHRVLPSSNL